MCVHIKMCAHKNKMCVYTCVGDMKPIHARTPHMYMYVPKHIHIHVCVKAHTYVSKYIHIYAHDIFANNTWLHPTSRYLLVEYSSKVFTCEYMYYVFT